jgi:hypothetical protein
MKKLFCRVYWLVLIPLWVVFGIVPFFSVMFGFDSVMARDPNYNGWWLYGYFHLTTEQSNIYYFTIVGASLVMSVLWKLEWIFNIQLKSKRSSAS